MGFASDSEVWVNEETVDFPKGGMIGFIACRRGAARTMHEPTVFGEPAERVN